MNRRRLLLGVAAAVPAGISFAQFKGGKGGDMRGGKPPGGGRDPVAVLEITLHELGEDLKLRPEQEPLFDAYVERIRALAGDVARERAPRRVPAGLTMLQLIDRNVDGARNRLAALEDIALAAKALWVTLSEGQQRAADPRLATLMLLPLEPPALEGPGGPGGPPRRT
jgi:hypothetical protein